MSGNFNTNVLDYEGNTKPTSVEKAAYEPDMFATRIVDVGNNQQKRLDYGSRQDTQPVYVGHAPRGLATSANGWLLQKLTYDSISRIISITIGYGSWDNRASVTYS